MSTTSGRHFTPHNSPLRFCMNQDCRRYCHRSNRFRVWKVIAGVEGPLKFQKADIVLCPQCFDNRQLGKMINVAGGASILPPSVTKMIGFNQ